MNVAGDANARTGVAVHGDNVVLDHVAVSREPPGHLDVGISVEGARVHAYAISVRHVEQDGVRWRGEDGHALGINVDLPRDAAAHFQKARLAAGKDALKTAKACKATFHVLER